MCGGEVGLEVEMVESGASVIEQLEGREIARDICDIEIEILMI
jgi:hypothetical protein